MVIELEPRGLFGRTKMIDLTDHVMHRIRIIVGDRGAECQLDPGGKIPPVRQADPAKVLGLERDASAMHLGRVRAHEKMGDSGTQDRL